ncbi:hypothetical protein B2G74_33045 [Burkholderia sp. A27]|nr:hypothetical protein B2G74_33045 [Burkholderia sp. A27]
MPDNLKTLHDAMIAGLRAALPDISPIDAYPRIGRKIPTPSIALELSEMEPGHDPIACAVHAQTWGVPVTPARLVQIGDDPFKPELDAYLVWLVEWTHEFDLGDVAAPFPSAGSAVLWGIDPDTGTAPGAECADPAAEPSGG